MSDCKHYIRLYLIFLIIFLCYHIFVWNTITKKIFNLPDEYYVGDLGRMSYQINSLHIRQDINDLPKKHIESYEWNGEKVDIVTIGDSASKGGGRGKNNFYQDWIASNQGLTVLNIPIYYKTDNYIETIVVCHNSGLLDILKPKAIIIECAERTAIINYAKKN